MWAVSLQAVALRNIHSQHLMRSLVVKTTATPYTIRTTTFENGERMPILVHVESGLPVFDACVYATTEVRPKSGSSATIDQALRGVQFLLSFADSREIDLRGRFTSGQFLALHELDDLVRMAYKPMGGPSEHWRPNGVIASVPKEATLDRVLKRALISKDASQVSIGTASIRLYYVRVYLEWLGHSLAGKICTTLEQKTSYLEALRECLGWLRARTPVARRESTRQGLSNDQKDCLVEVIDPAHETNPWTGDFIRDRNRLLVLWGLGTGLRRGELLGLRIRLIDFRKNMAAIMRRPDDKHDPRKYQPNTKTRQRSIGISEELAYLTHQHIVKLRSKIKGAQKHDFLFVAEDTGRPLSLAALSKVFRTLREKHPGVSETISSHILRHTWNEDFSDVADEAGLSEGDERRARVHAMGWSETSTSANHYLKRRTKRQAAAASIRIQQAVIAENPKQNADAERK
jgi:integrase